MSRSTKPYALNKNDDERRAFIEAALAFADDFEDGAWFAYLDEVGISMEELERLGFAKEAPDA